MDHQSKDQTSKSHLKQPLSMPVDYSMRISRLTVDKLGVKLYDKVSAVIAELIANAYDADATKVTVSAPMGKYLATRPGADDKRAGKEFNIKIVDNGIGMTPEQMQKFFLVVGAERRTDERGDESPRFQRKVMGRKGVGKLAPFGICKTIEVISAGGKRIDGKDSSCSGYHTSHILLHYDDILNLSNNDPDKLYKPTPGNQDNRFLEETGTQIILKNFNYRKVPDIDTLGRQLAQRFGLESQNWQIELLDNIKRESSPTIVSKFNVDTMPNTRITFQSDHSVLLPDGTVAHDLRAGFDHNGTPYSLSGWMAYSKKPYKDELMAGVRIYCRGKIAAQTSIFNQRAGFTGEHNIRSYLVGELHADWLDENEDLIQTDRRDILWSDELAAAFEVWGQNIVKRIGTLSRDPLRKATLQLFLETGDVDKRIHDAYPADDHKTIRKSAEELAHSFGRMISRAEAEDEDSTVVGELVDLSITLAPHIALTSMMKEAVADADRPLSALTSFLRTARLAELSSFGRIAEDRLKVLKRLEILKDAEETNENDLQQLIAAAPWLINPEWAPVTANQSFSSLRKEFEKYFNKQEEQHISLSNFKEKNKRPDFVLSNQEHTVQIIEIKRPNHRLTNSEMKRIVAYHDNMDEFLEDLADTEFHKHFTDFHITLVCDHLALTGPERAAFNGYRDKGKLTRMNWSAFLFKTKQVHQDFLNEAQRQRDTLSSVSKGD